MRICFIANCRNLGGAERVLLETIDVLKERGVECRVLLAGSGMVAQELDAFGVPYAFLEGGSWVSWTRPSFGGRVKAAARITSRLTVAMARIRRWGCDAIYSNTLTVCNGAIIARLLQLPHIWHLHEFGREDHGIFYKFGERFSNRAIGPLSSACVVVSNALAAKYAPYIPTPKLAVIYPSMHRARDSQNGSDIEPGFAPAEANRLRLVIVGALAEGKGQVDALQALARLLQDGVNAELLVVGEGNPTYRHKLLEIARSSALDGRVLFVGGVKDSFPFMRAADVVLVCSRSEAFGRVTIEAMLAGKPVVGADCGATSELVQEGFNGLLYKCGEPADLAAKIRLLKEQPVLLKRLGVNGKKWAAGYFTRERYADELVAVLRSIGLKVPTVMGG